MKHPVSLKFLFLHPLSLLLFQTQEGKVKENLINSKYAQLRIRTFHNFFVSYVKSFCRDDVQSFLEGGARLKILIFINICNTMNCAKYWCINIEQQVVYSWSNLNVQYLHYSLPNLFVDFWNDMLIQNNFNISILTWGIQ